MSSTEKIQRKILALEQSVTSKEIRKMMALHNMGRITMTKMIAAPTPRKRVKFYSQLLLINDALGIPTWTLEQINATTPYPDNSKGGNEP